MENNFGVFYTCFTEKKSVEYSLKKLFEVYPDVPVYLVSDGGANYDFLYKIFPDKNLKIKLEEDSRGIIAVIDRNQDHFSPKNKQIMTDTIRIFLRRVNDAVDFCGTKNILVMEPDVLLRGKLNIPEDCKLMTNCVNNVITPLSRKLVPFMEKYKGAVPPKKYGMPIIFSSSYFKIIMKKLEEEPELIEKIYMLEPHFPYYDKMFEIIFSLIGINGKFNPEVTECFRDKNWKTNGKPLVHQYREFYPSKEEHNSTYSTEGHQILTDAFKNNKI